VHYADGGVARLPVRYARDVAMWIEPAPATAHVAWRPMLARAENGSAYARTVDFYRIRLANPHSERAVRSVDVEILPVTWNGFSVLAITVDPVGPGAASASQQGPCNYPGCSLTRSRRSVLQWTP